MKPKLSSGYGGEKKGKCLLKVEKEVFKCWVNFDILVLFHFTVSEPEYGTHAMDVRELSSLKFNMYFGFFWVFETKDVEVWHQVQTWN